MGRLLVLGPIVQTLPTIPTPVWEQIAVVIVFAALGVIALKIFERIVCKIADNFAVAIKAERDYDSAERKQDREKIEQLINKFGDMVKEFQRISTSMEQMIEEFKEHDRMVRDEFKGIRKPSRAKKSTDAA